MTVWILLKEYERMKKAGVFKTQFFWDEQKEALEAEGRLPKKWRSYPAPSQQTLVIPTEEISS